MGITDDFCFSYSAQCLSTPRPAHRGRLRRRARVGAGCGVLRVRLVTAPPGGARQNRPSAITSGTCECTNARPRAPLMCNARRFRQGGTGAHKPPRWSAERRAFPLERKAPRKRLRAYVTRPPTGAAAPERLSALRPLDFRRGNKQAPEDVSPREHDQTCLAVRSGHASFRGDGACKSA